MRGSTESASRLQRSWRQPQCEQDAEGSQQRDFGAFGGNAEEVRVGRRRRCLG